MIRKVLHIFIIFWTCNTLASTPMHVDFNKETKAPYFKLSNSDKRIGNNFKKIYQLSLKNILNKSLILHLHRDILSNKNFKHLAPWTKSLIKINKSRSINRISKVCTKIRNSQSKDLLLQELLKHSLNNCQLKYLSLVTKSLNKRKITKTQLKDLFGEINQTQLTKYERPFINLLKASKRNNKRNYFLISSSLIGEIQKKKLIPGKDLIKASKVSAKFTRYIQSIDLNPNLTNRIFYNELKKLKNHTFNLLDKNANNLEIKKANDELYNYYNNIKEFLPKKKAMATILSLSKSFLRRSFYDEAERGFKLIISEKNHSYQDAVFNLMWSNYLQNDFDDALEVISSNITNNSSFSTNSKLHFWKGKLLSLTGNEKEARDIFKNLISFNPLSFYAILSAKELSNDNDEETKNFYISNLPKDNKPRIKANWKHKRWVKRVSLWADNNLSRFVNLEIKNIVMSNPDKSINDQLHQLAYQLKRNKNYLESFKIIYKSVNRKLVTLDAGMLKILFPKPFFTQIEKATTDFDPIIALSLIRQESGFNKFAKSHVGARGLMQLMPNTARQFKRKLKSKHLYNPSLNIRIGTKYFNSLLENYDNNLVYSLAAYNAGESRVNEWQQEYMTSNNILKNIENIPFLETRKYVKLIFRNIFFYKMILNKDLKDSSELNEIYDIKLGFNG